MSQITIGDKTLYVLCADYVDAFGQVISNAVNTSAAYNDSLSGYINDDELTTISGPTFSGCTNLQNVTFGSGLISVGTSSGLIKYSIFTGCTNLTEITCLAPTAPTLLTKSIQGIENNNGALYVPQGSDYRTWTAILKTWNVQYLT